MEETKHGLEIVTRYFGDFTPAQLEQLALLGPVYEQWNRQINVISRKDIDHLYEKHILHSLSIAALFNFRAGGQVLDIGTGGGFPGVPLAIFFPETHFHLVDSIGKKLRVIEAVIEKLQLKNVSVQHIRAEEINGKRFDCVVSRAVAPLRDLWTWTKPLLKTYKHLEPDAENENPIAHGLLCLKGGDLAAEISASGLRPRIMEVSHLFPLETFKEKFLLYISAQR